MLPQYPARCYDGMNHPKSDSRRATQHTITQSTWSLGFKALPNPVPSFIFLTKCQIMVLEMPVVYGF